MAWRGRGAASPGDIRRELTSDSILAATVAWRWADAPSSPGRLIVWLVRCRCCTLPARVPVVPVECPPALVSRQIG